MKEYSKRCGNCANYFINRNWKKLCVEVAVGEDGKRRIKVKSVLGMMGDMSRACDSWKPSEGYLRLKSAKKGGAK